MIYDQSTITENLRQQINRGEVCAFIGAGLSIGSGLSSWYDLVKELSNRINYELPPLKWATGDALIDATQAYANELGFFSLISFLKEKLDTTHHPPTAAHRALTHLPISLVFTANYDDLLERAYREAGKRVEVVVKDETIPFMRRGSDVVNIVKLYGDLAQPDTLVLAREQYESFFLNRPQMVKLLEVELSRSNVLYLGWSHTDPHFNLIFGEMLARFEKFIRPGCAVMFELSEARQKELQRKQIRLVELSSTPDRTEQLAAWLAKLAPSTVPIKGSEEDIIQSKPVLNTGKAWAVLVGINNYQDTYIADLSVCVSDVTTIHELLKQRFQATRLLTDATVENPPTRANILATLATTALAAEERDLLLFYFSGHGIADSGESYLVPCDARRSALKQTAISMRDIRELFDQSSARAKVIILDACHSGADIGKAALAMTPEFIQRVFEEAEGMAVISSCKQGQLSYEWPLQNRSVFTHFLLEALQGKADLDQKGFVTVSDVSRYVVDGVKQWSVSHSIPQTPTLQYTVAGDIILLHRQEIA